MNVEDTVIGTNTESFEEDNLKKEDNIEKLKIENEALRKQLEEKEHDIKAVHNKLLEINEVLTEEQIVETPNIHHTPKEEHKQSNKGLLFIILSSLGLGYLFIVEEEEYEEHHNNKHHSKEHKEHKEHKHSKVKRNNKKKEGKKHIEEDESSVFESLESLFE